LGRLGVLQAIRKFIYPLKFGFDSVCQREGISALSECLKRFYLCLVPLF